MASSSSFVAPGSSRAAWFRRFAFALVLSSVLMLTGVGAGYLYINGKIGNISTVPLELTEGPANNFLIIGSDSREFVASEQDAASFGEVGGKRSDTIILVRVDPKTRKALLVSFPRDLWVEIPGRGSAKINAAFQDGPQKVVDTISTNFSIPIHHYVEIDFSGFRNVVNAMGGVEMYVAAPARDPKTGLDIPTAGCVTLNGDQALGWVRSRNYQYFESGTWRTDPSGDFGRINRQQDFIRRLISQGLDAGASNPIRGDGLIDSGIENITADDGLSTGDILKLVRVFRSGDPGDVEMLTVPADVGRRGGQSVVILRDGEAEALFERLRGEGEVGGDILPSAVKVRVLNGTGGAGIATRTSRELGEAGFLPAGVGDADRFGYDRTEIHYREGERAKAELLQRYLGGVGSLSEDSSIGPGADLVLVVGEDFEGVSAAGDAAGLPAEVAAPMLPVAAVHGQDDEPEPAGTDPSPDC